MLWSSFFSHLHLSLCGSHNHFIVSHWWLQKDRRVSPISCCFISVQGQTWPNPTAQTAAVNASTSSSNRKKRSPQSPASWVPTNRRRLEEGPVAEQSRPWPIWRQHWWVRTACCRCGLRWWQTITPCCMSTCLKEDTPCHVSRYLPTLCSPWSLHTLTPNHPHVLL